MPDRLSRHARQLARRLVVGERRVELRDAGERATRRRASGRLIGSMEDDPEGRPHLRFLYLEAGERRLLSRERRRKEQGQGDQAALALVRESSVVNRKAALKGRRHSCNRQFSRPSVQRMPPARNA